MEMPPDEEISKIIGKINNSVDNERTDELLKSLHLISRNHGLDHLHFKPVINLAVSSKLNVPQSKIAFKCLIPRNSVPWEAVITAISHLSTNKLPDQIQVKIVEWISKNINAIDDIKPIHSVYNILFHYLETGYLASHIVKILSKLTVKKDVSPCRIQKLAQLCIKTRAPAHLSVLLHTYRTLCPREVEHAFQTNSTSPELIPRQNLLKRKICDSEKKEKRRKTAEQSETSENQMLMPFYGFASHYARLNGNKNGLPCSPLILLQNPNVLREMCIQYKSEVPLRLDTWLKFFLAECCFKSEVDYFNSLDNVLSDLAIFQEHIQEGIPATNIFLKRFFDMINFDDYLSSILALMVWIPICQIDELYTHFLEPLVKLCFKPNFNRQKMIINAFTKMLQNFAFEESNKRNSTYVKIFKTKMDTNLEKNGNQSLEILVQFISYMSELFVNLLAERTDILDSILSFYKVIPELHLKYNLPIIELPPKPIIEICLLYSNAYPVARLCALICRYKLSFKSLKQIPEHGPEPATEILNRSLGHIKSFNSLLLLICDVLFRNRAFTDENNSFYLSHETLKRIPITHKQEKLSLYHHFAFIGFAFKFLSESQNDNQVGALRYAFIKPEVKELYFKYLKNWNLDSIWDFYIEFIRKKEP